MSKMSDIQRRVDEAMASIDGIGRATPNPFFYTRLEARLTAGRANVWDTISRSITRPAVVLATLSLILILNTAVVIEGISASDEVPELSEITSMEDLRASTMNYDIDNNQP